MTECICQRAPTPFDHLHVVSKECLAHYSGIRLLAAGWVRNGEYWTHAKLAGIFNLEAASDFTERGIVQ